MIKNRLKSPRLNITVPLRVFELVHRNRDRMNISAVCAKALEEHCRLIEGPRGDRSCVAQACHASR